MLKLYALGVHGWMPHDGLLTSCLAIETDKEVIVLDCGSGFSRIFDYPELLKKTLKIFLSHSHLDHTNGLFYLYALPELEDIQVSLYCDPQTLIEIAPLLNIPLSVPFLQMAQKIDFRFEDINELSRTFLVPLKHSVRCLGIGFEVNGKEIAYCTDTGLCDNLYELIQGADVAILECTWTDPTFEDEGHLNPRTAAQVAKDAGVGRLLLTHFTGTRPGGPFATRASILEAESVARQIFHNTTALLDGMVLDI